MKASQLFSVEQKAQMVDAVARAEMHTSAEVRIYIESKCSGDVLKRSAKIFRALDMNNTQLRNAVLVYVAMQSHKLAILGDKGINDVVEDGFWDSIYLFMREEFMQGRPTEGICGAVESVGKKLQHFFPRSKDDINELSDEPTFGQ